MTLSIYERRKFVRLETNFAGTINSQVRVAIKNLSLGGCLVESSNPLDEASAVRLDFSAFDEAFSLAGNAVNHFGEHRFGLRFELASLDDTARLAKIIKQIHLTPEIKRPTRIRILRDAFLDGVPSVITTLGEGGCFVRTRAAYRIGDVVDIRLKLGAREVKLSGQVRWKGKLGIGVQYLSASPDQRAAISDFISTHAKKRSR